MIVETTNTIFFKRVTKNDIDDIVLIENESFKHPWKKETFESELNNPYSRFFIAKKENSPAGFIIYWDIPYEIHLINIAVRPQFRRMNIGSMLLGEMIKYAKDKKKHLITLEVRISNIGAINFYKKFGFKEAGIREKYYVDNDEDAIVMELYIYDKI
ncbi:MAG: ribosomal protein S18-alanine N-acetyltransferase [Deltaproteobacteria bacterium]|nr:ribosomal protein S18-alanine N-acetyltransferase [Deltaproteobacteria bacterium]